MIPLIWTCEPLASPTYDSKGFHLKARHKHSGREARRYYGHLLVRDHPLADLLLIMEFDVRQMANELLP